ncbi:MAG: EI24 domain-containing protein [Myxococcaceae bacterium]|nr:EI24 domain-containing protein [Myxococcaceae bacterium]
MPSDSPVPTLSGGLSDFFVGLGLPFRSLGLIFKGGKLRTLSVVSFVVTGLTLVGLVGLMWDFAWRITRAIVSEGALSWLVGLPIFAAIFIPAALTVPNLVLAPLQDPISEATEERCGNFTAPRFSLPLFIKSIGTSLAHTASRLAIIVLGFIVLFPLHFVPVLGSAVYFAASTAWAAWWLTAEYLSGPMARHLMPFKRVTAAMRARPMVSLGFGLALYVVLWVPVLNFFLVPVAVVGGTLLFRALHTSPTFLEGPVSPG